MKQLQRYVSKELTHFVGRDDKREGSHDKDAQYERLVKILRERCLQHRKACPNGPERVTFRGDGSFVGRTMIEVAAVYFCDIPVEDLALHMGKYSSFGLGFPKSLLVKKGANPAFYIAADSIVAPDDPAAAKLFRGSSARPNPLTRAALLEQLIRDYLASGSRLNSMAFRERIDSGITQNGTAIATASFLDLMIRAHFISFCVPFDSGKDERDLENYYMEREWRILGEVKFELEEVCRVILPSGYARRFRSDLPDYYGQVTFSE